MPEEIRCVSPPSIRFLRWLIDPGPDVREEVRAVLRSRMFASAGAIVMGVVNSIMVSVVALAMNCTRLFAVFIAMDVVLGLLRVAVIRRVDRAVTTRGPPPMNIYMITGILWCALQGMITFTAMGTNDPTLKILSTIVIFGVIGPISARNYPAPRYAILLVMLCDLPFVAGCVLSGNHWLLITIPETPPFLYAANQVIKTFQLLAISSLTAELESRRRATHDPLTGLLNRNGFQEAAQHHAQIQTPNLCVLALDLDGFKAVNDTLGHHVGDALLAAVAGRLSARVRAGDQVIRLGGDEFVVLLNNVTPLEAGTLADRIIQDIGKNPYQLEGAAPVHVGVSIGIACAPADGSQVEELSRHADAALYEAKAAGRGVYRRYIRL